eukprot:4178980-Alexandrium_andersonii.AAC.1
MLDQLVGNRPCAPTGDLDGALTDNGRFALLLPTATTGLDAAKSKPEICVRRQNGRPKVLERSAQLPRLRIVTEYSEHVSAVVGRKTDEGRDRRPAIGRRARL